MASKAPLKCFPQVTFDKQTHHFTINYAVFVKRNNVTVAYADTPQRAELVANAINSWRKTKAGKRWWRTL